jgi:hypothetical protein
MYGLIFYLIGLDVLLLKIINLLKFVFYEKCILLCCFLFGN